MASNSPINVAFCGTNLVRLDQRGSKRFTLKEVHRFGYEPVAMPDKYVIVGYQAFWDEG